MKKWSNYLLLLSSKLEKNLDEFWHISSVKQITAPVLNYNCWVSAWECFIPEAEIHFSSTNDLDSFSFRWGEHLQTGFGDLVPSWVGRSLLSSSRSSFVKKRVNKLLNWFMKMLLPQVWKWDPYGSGCSLGIILSIYHLDHFMFLSRTRQQFLVLLLA